MQQSLEKRLAFWKFDPKPIPIVTSIKTLKRFRPGVLGMLPGGAVVAGLFTTVLFLTSPRHVKPWFSPITYKVSSTSLRKEVELNDTGKVKSTSRRIFEAKFYLQGAKGTNYIPLGELPYFRGIALSNLSMSNGKTRWNAAYERVSPSTYQSIKTVKRIGAPRFAVMKVRLDKTAEPILYSLMPAGNSDNPWSKLRFCHEISAFTRSRENEQIDFAQFDYEFVVPLTSRNIPARAWPYIANTLTYSTSPMEKDPAQKRWLTRIDRKYYPTLVGIADRIAAKVRSEGGGRGDLVREIENHFLDVTNYSYTLDYTDVERNDDIDPNEDFVANFKTGHCEAFASAMTLMLRSQGIPARMVTGFHGGQFVERKQAYVVNGRHGHAWVEVYLRNEDCKEAGLESWEYNEGGAWLRADPTPPQNIEDDSIGAEGAIDLARTVWQDYVLGMESGKQSEDQDSMSNSLARFFGGWNLNEISAKIKESREYGVISMIRPILVLVLIVAGLLYMLRVLIIKAGYEEEQPDTTVGKIKRFFADAIGLISSDLREWVIGYDSETMFYRKLTDILESHEMTRKPNQTHLEFAGEVSSTFESHPSSKLISSIVADITKAFNRVRFGLQELELEEQTLIDGKLKELESLLREQTPRSTTA
jgi:transglutaminase-like putative cysteine protease